MKNPFNPKTEPYSHKFFEEKHNKYVSIGDQNTDFSLVVIKSTPHCKIHGAMNKVSTYEKGGYWRCLQGLCRAGCEQINPIK